jgi:murein DD-endopeptidase MepM/ murein hydrolase activator NlpD
MSPSVSRRRRLGRPRRPPRRRDRRPRRLAISAVFMKAISSRMPAIRFALVVIVVWSIATGTYFVFRDDVFTPPTPEMQITYEDHIADLRAQIDRIISRQFLDQEAVEQQLNGLLQRQATLEQRASALTGDRSAIKSMNPTPIVPPVADEKALPSPINDTVVTPPDQETAGMLARVSLSLDKIERKQAAALGELEERIYTKARNIRSVLADLGVPIAKTPGNSATGGPWVPIKPPQPGADAFERQLDRIKLARLQIDGYAHALLAVPVRKPLIGDVETSSPFGVRRDPFLGRPAIHPGIDLRGDAGEPVRATATGSVTIAGRRGGYGNMVEIGHGNGLTTRYGHLSEIDVKVGQTVRIGEVVGKIGSTGRSTGPHLHYETRINGEAVDPQKFLRAGLRLGNN